MPLTPALLPLLIEAANETINTHGQEVTELDLAIGDGDHVCNLQRGLATLMQQRDELRPLDWATAFQKIGMSILSTVGGASGSLFGTFFIALGKAVKDQDQNLKNFAASFNLAVTAVKQRGKSDGGEKTLLDVLIPVANYLLQAAAQNTDLPEALETIKQVAIQGMESTRDMLATKGRASFLDERSLGHIDAGARTTQLMMCAMVDVLAANLD